MPRTNTLSMWDVDAAAFPEVGTPAARLRFLVRYAVLAPSSHNSQPWLFHVEDDALELRADRSRALPVVDPDDRALVMSCGAALEHLCIAARHFGRATEVERLPQGPGSDLLARVRLAGPDEEPAAEARLFEAIPERRTNRLSFDPCPVPNALLVELEAEAAARGATLRILRDTTERRIVASRVAEGDRIQGAHAEFRRELAHWLRPNTSSSGDGIPGYACGQGEWASRATPLVVRTFSRGRGRAATDRQLAEGSPVLCVLYTSTDDPAAWMAAGRALARVLLRAQSAGISASFLNQPIELPALRLRWRALLGDGAHAQLLLRMGYGRPLPPTPRRPLDEVLS